MGAMNRRGPALVLACGWLLLTWAAPAFAAPGVMNYQGRLTNTSGNPVTSTVSVTFTFWSAATNGSQLGSGFSDTDSVTPDANGVCSTEIGDDPGNPIPPPVFASDSVWLNVNVGGTSIVPRTHVSSSGFAINALPGSGPAYEVVKVTDSQTSNGANLLAAYARAKTLTPYNSLLGSTNRVVVLVPPARYDLRFDQLVMDTRFVDLVGMSTAHADQYIFGRSNGPGTGVLRITTTDVHLENLTVFCLPSAGLLNNDASDPAAYYPDTNLHTEAVNCEFGNSPFAFATRVGIIYPGTYTNCVAADYAFGAFSGTASGIFTNCTCGYGSFAGLNGIASGTFRNCTGTGPAFGGHYGTGSGTFIDCIGGQEAFGFSASGTFNRCTGGQGSFGGIGGNASGTFTGCSGGPSSFASDGTANGTFTNCTAGDGSFAGGSVGVATGLFAECTGGNNSFGTGGTAPGGRFRYCAGGTSSFTTAGSPQVLYCTKDGVAYP